MERVMLAILEGSHASAFEGPRLAWQSAPRSSLRQPTTYSHSLACAYHPSGFQAADPSFARLDLPLRNGRPCSTAPPSDGHQQPALCVMSPSALRHTSW